ncbi:MAG: TetR/AcrR family transcriptional regulator [Selenomonadaceae bacterium]|nr:TetR/AcrR family transcriptional regulator [Selenomonadaceae bacterium]
MDRRQRKTRAAIFNAFKSLLNRKSYYKITVQEIIDAADVGRSTFYDHFETKDALIESLCRELFEHIAQSLLDRSHSHCKFTSEGDDRSAFCHILYHLQEDERYILRLIARERNENFLRYFQQNMNELLRDEKFFNPKWRSLGVPEDFLIDHISSSFVNMIQWWVRNKMQPEPPTMDAYFRSMMSAVI